MLAFPLFLLSVLLWKLYLQWKFVLFKLEFKFKTLWTLWVHKTNIFFITLFLYFLFEIIWTAFVLEIASSFFLRDGLWMEGNWLLKWWDAYVYFISTQSLIRLPDMSSLLSEFPWTFDTDTPIIFAETYWQLICDFVEYCGFIKLIVFVLRYVKFNVTLGTLMFMFCSVFWRIFSGLWKTLVNFGTSTCNLYDGALCSIYLESRNSLKSHPNIWWSA